MRASEIEGRKATVLERLGAAAEALSLGTLSAGGKGPGAPAIANDDDPTSVIILYVRTAFWFICGTMTCLSVIDLIGDTPFFSFNLVTRLFTLAISALILTLGLRKASARSTAVATVCFCAVVLGSTVWQVSFTGDPFSAPLAAVGLALVAAWSLPWAIGYQVVLAALGAAAIVANAAVTEHFDSDIVVPLLLAAGSVPMAALGRRQRVALAVARSEVRQAGEQLHRIAENAEEVLWVFDLATSSIAYISPGVESLCGVSAAAIRQTLDGFLGLVHPEDRDRVSGQIARAGEMAGPARVDHRICRPDGTVRWVQLRLAPIRNDAGKVVRVGGVIRDTTAEREIAEAQRRAREEAEATARLKDQFLANMSHEIRTPLNGVIGMVDLLQESSLAPAQRAHVETIHTCGKQLLSLVTDLLDFSKIEAGKVDVMNVELDVGDLVAYVVQLFGARAEEKGIDLSYRIDIPPFAAFRGDPELLRQILTNLVANAIKFTDGGSVVVRGSVAEDAQQLLLQFEVEDTGVGVAPAAQANIFEPFMQADASTSRRFGGTGLGLAIAQRLARLLGGEIRFRSTEGHGSTFWFTARVEQLVTDAADDRTLPPKRVLVAAANPESRACLSAELTAWALRVHQVSSVDDVGSALGAGIRRRQPYDLLIADMSGLGMTAVEFIRSLRQVTAEFPAAIGFISASGQAGDRPAACDAGAAFYLHVPARPRRLFECLQALWESAADRAPFAAQQPARHILIVEDNLLNQRVAVAIVERVGHVAQVATSGREALDALEAGGLDAVLMDCQLPDMDGFETTARIRERERGGRRRIPVIALTASATQAARDRCLAAGMDDYLTKPIQRATLAEVLARWLSKSDNGLAPGGSAQPIDRARLQELTNGDPVQLARYARMFHDELVLGLGEIHGGANDSDTERVLAALHRLKGAAACVGAAGVLDTLSRLEEQARADGIAGVRLGSAEVEEAYQEFLEALKSVAGRVPV